MDIEKIEKLINSGNFQDVYLGLALFDKLDRGDRLKILRRNFTYINDNVFTWGKEGDISGVPEEYEGNYIRGRHYAYAIDPDTLIIDNKRIYTRLCKRKQQPFKTIETWE